jgi:putative Ca2+/H+ antiporter (TMEM165/GDT1 family)
MSIFFAVDMSGRTDHAAHIGGVIMGILVAIYLCKMPGFITKKISNGEERIRLIALISILSYFLITLFIFYFFMPVNLK